MGPFPTWFSPWTQSDSDLTVPDGIGGFTAHIERLEERVVPAVNPLGAEMNVVGPSAVHPDVAVDANGNFVVVWSQNDGSDFGTFARRFNAAGSPVGSAFRVNSYTTLDQYNASIAMNATGNFVVSWQSGWGQDGYWWGVFGQRYNAAGSQVGSEFQVNTYWTYHQDNPHIAMNDNGNFVVTWRSLYQDGSGTYGIYAQRYAANGTAIGGEFLVPTNTALAQLSPAVAMDAAGNFVIVWQSDAGDGSGQGVFAQRFASNGTRLGGEFRVNTHTTNDQARPAIAMDVEGNFVVAWRSSGQDGSSSAVYAQRFDATGNPVGSEFRVSTNEGGNQVAGSGGNDPISIGMNSTGSFVITWNNLGLDGDSWGVFGQYFSPDGRKIGEEFRINGSTTNSQMFSKVAMDESGNFVVVWLNSAGDPGSPGTIYARRFMVDPPPVVTDVFTGSTNWTIGFANHLQNTGLGELPFGYRIPTGSSNQTRTLPWSNLNQISIRFDQDVPVEFADLNVYGVSVLEYALEPAGFSYDASTFTATWTLANGAVFSNDKILLRLSDDLGGTILDGEWTDGVSTESGDGSPGGEFHFRFNVLPGDVDQSNAVFAGDVVVIRDSQFQFPGSAGYSHLRDIDGSGTIFANDVINARDHQFTFLPGGEPQIPQGDEGFLDDDGLLLDSAAFLLSDARVSDSAESVVTLSALDTIFVEASDEPLTGIGSPAPAPTSSITPAVRTGRGIVLENLLRLSRNRNSGGGQPVDPDVSLTTVLGD